MRRVHVAFGVVFICGAAFAAGFVAGESTTASAARVVPAPPSPAASAEPSRPDDGRSFPWLSPAGRPIQPVASPSPAPGLLRTEAVPVPPGVTRREIVEAVAEALREERAREEERDRRIRKALGNHYPPHGRMAKTLSMDDAQLSRFRDLLDWQMEEMRIRPPRWDYRALQAEYQRRLRELLAPEQAEILSEVCAWGY